MTKLIGLCCIAAAVCSAAPKPNVLVIYTDDHRYTGVHALGGEAVQTPNLDRLAEKGIAPGLISGAAINARINSPIR